MISSHTSAAGIGTPQPGRARGWAALLPREPGSWAFVLEPLALALLAAPSWRGGGLAAAGMVWFLMRRPWQIWSCGHRDARGRMAAVALVVSGVLAGTLALAAVMGSAAGLFGPGLAVAVAGLVLAWCDREGAARTVMAECAGAGAFAALGMGIVLLAGDAGANARAQAVGGFALIRGVTSILTVRAYVRRRKGENRSGELAIIVAAVACVVAWSPVGGLGTRVGAAWSSVFLVRTFWLVGRWAPSWPARRVGWMELALGALAVVSTGISLR